MRLFFRDGLRTFGNGLLLGLLLLLAGGCAPPSSELPTPVLPTATATETPFPTATIVWFPPTATFTPAPTRTAAPTQDLRPGVGDILLADDFSDKDRWQTARTAVGSIAYGANELTLAVASTKGVLVSLRDGPVFDNFYIEVDALPSLCREGDVYGLLLRASSKADYYRLLVNCNGMLRMERIVNSRTTLIQDWTASGQLPSGGMMRSRLGVWAQGEELRIFVNGAYQFSVRDPVFPSGGLGVFARSAGDTPLTVSFSNLVVSALGSSRPLAPTRSP